MNDSLGALIAERRKALGLTQLELAQKLGVTDKAVSKWERNLSCPDVGTLPCLAEILGLSLEQLMQVEPRQEVPAASKTKQLVRLVLRAVPLAMGVAVAILSAMGKLETKSGLSMLGLGLGCLSLYLLEEN